MARPSIFVTTDSHGPGRTVEEIREAITDGRSRTLWAQIRRGADQDVDSDPILPTTSLPGRSEEAERTGALGFTITRTISNRLLRGALANLLTGKEQYRDSVLGQLEALFDTDRYPDWGYEPHGEFSLRHGQLSRAVALAYDWLSPNLSAAQQEWIVEGLDRQGIQPYFEAQEADLWWTDADSNWMTVIVGGFGIVGMVLGEDHPRSEELIDLSVSPMESYLDVFGPDGEFNESVAYGGSINRVVAYFVARRQVTGEERLATSPIPDACRWLLYGTLPPGRYAAHGDSHVEHDPAVEFFPAVATATEDPILQWYYEQYADAVEEDSRRRRPLELLWYDESLEARPPTGGLPLGRAFPSYGGLVSSRTEWDADSAASVVYGKAGIEPRHAHHDAGQVCLDGYGRRLLRDLGSPAGGYPPDYGKNRWEYYNASSHGHNVLEFDGREMFAEPGLEGEFLASEFEETTGGFWRMDLSKFYDVPESVRRTVVHLFPHTAVVLDEAELPRSADVSLRWHTPEPAAPDEEGRFTAGAGEVGLVSRVLSLAGNELTYESNRHEYREPYHKSRQGNRLEQRREPYTEALLPDADSCRLLSLFNVVPPEHEPGTWETHGGNWVLDSPSETVTVRVNGSAVTVSDRSDRSLTVSL